MHILNEQWLLIRHLFEEEKGRPGRPKRSAREVLEGVLWICKTGAQWNALPAKYPPYQTCHRRYNEWRRKGILRQMFLILQADLEHKLVTTGPAQPPEDNDLTDLRPTKRGSLNKFADTEILLNSAYVHEILNEQIRISD